MRMKGHGADLPKVVSMFGEYWMCFTVLHVYFKDK